MGNNTATITPNAETTAVETTAVETIAAATGELLHIDPAELVLDDNVRTDPVLGKDFIASVATGVRLPLYAVRDADGTVKVRDGQRRMLAAREAGLTSVPVYVVAADQAVVRVPKVDPAVGLDIPRLVILVIGVVVLALSTIQYAVSVRRTRLRRALREANRL